MSGGHISSKGVQVFKHESNTQEGAGEALVLLVLGEVDIWGVGGVRWRRGEWES